LKGTFERKMLLENIHNNTHCDNRNCVLILILSEYDDTTADKYKKIPHETAESYDK
jgi:hypothetical protein